MAQRKDIECRNVVVVAGALRNASKVRDGQTKWRRSDPKVDVCVFNWLASE
jgi:hypothetical protein